MLRPALLLPPKRLVTPRSVRPPLDGRLGSAIGRSGTCPNGTHTRWLGEVFRTHHARNLAQRLRDPRARYSPRRRSIESRKGSALSQDRALVHYRCVNPRHREAPGSGSDTLTIHERKWAYCPHDIRARGHEWKDTGGLTMTDLKLLVDNERMKR